MRSFIRACGGVLAIAAGFALFGLLVAAGVKSVCDSAFYSGYDPSLPTNVLVRAEAPTSHSYRVAFTFQGLRGESVPAVLHMPAEPSGRFPCVVFLHGIGQDKAFVDTIAPAFTSAGFAIVSFDQHMRGERILPETAGTLRAAWAFRQRAAKTVVETRRLVDALAEFPSVARERVYLLGASYGAITGATAMARETRIEGGVLCYGGADIWSLLDSEAAQNEMGVMHLPARLVATWLLSPADPLKCAGRVSERGVLMQNGREDPLIPVRAAEALHSAIVCPKQVVWFEGGHVGEDPFIVERALTDAVEFLRQLDLEGAKETRRKHLP